jgi:hypothetical protein
MIFVRKVSCVALRLFSCDAEKQFGKKSLASTTKKVIVLTNSDHKRKTILNGSHVTMQEMYYTITFVEKY